MTKISESAQLIKCSLSETTKIWNNVYARNLTTENDVSIGDFSRIENCRFGSYVNIQRNNLIYDSTVGRYTSKVPSELAITDSTLNVKLAMMYGSDVMWLSDVALKLETEPWSGAIL